MCDYVFVVLFLFMAAILTMLLCDDAAYVELSLQSFLDIKEKKKNKTLQRLFKRLFSANVSPRTY